MKNLYIHGSFMNDNYGDFLLFNEIMKECNQYRSNFRVYSSEVDDKFYKQFVTYECMPKKEAINKADLAVLAGGGYFGEPNKLKLLWNIRFLIKHAYPIYKLIRRNVPVCIIGVGFGPLNFFLSRKLSVQIFNKAKYVAVRDIESKQFLKKYGVHNSIRVYPDWIMGCDENVIISDNDFDEFNGKWLIHLTTKYEEDNDPVAIIIEDIKKLKKEGVLFAVITDQGNERQIERAKKIYSKLGSNMPIYYYNNPFDLSKIIDGCRGVITDKLHVGIVASLFNKPVISLSAHPKTMRFYKQIGNQDENIMLDDIRPGTIIKMYREVAQKNIDTSEIRIKAQGNKKLLKIFLEENK